MYQWSIEGIREVFADLDPNSGSVVKAMRYQPKIGNGGTVDETIELELSAPYPAYPDTIMEFLDSLGRGLWLAGQEAESPWGNHVYLRVVTSQFYNEIWQTQIIKGGIEMGKAGWIERENGNQMVTIHLTRRDWWEKSDENNVLLEYGNIESNNYTNGGMALINHADTQNSNVIDVPQYNKGLKINVKGDLPAPARVWLTLGDAETNTKPYIYLVGESWHNGPENLPTAHQGESGAARGLTVGTVTADAACAAGQYISLAWNGSADTELWRFDMAGDEIRIMQGRNFLPVLRLQSSLSTLSSEKFWYRWKIYKIVTLSDGDHEYLVSETPSQYMPAISQLVYGPPMALPPWPTDHESIGSSPKLRLVLAGSMAGSGAHTLKIDFCELFGLDGWRILRPVNEMDANMGFYDIGDRQIVQANVYTDQAFVTDGPGFQLIPGHSHRFWLLWMRMDAGDKVADPEFQATVGISYRPRRRML